MSKQLTTDTLDYPSDLNIIRPLFGVGIVALIASLIGYFLNGPQFFFSYLTSFTFFTSLCIGALFFIMLQHLTRAHWSVVVRRIPESITANIAIWGLFIIPVLLGMHYLYIWSNHDLVVSSKVLQHKSAYLNPTFFVIRQFIYFGLWGFLGWRMYSNSVKMDETGNWGLQTLMRRTSGPGMFLFAVSVPFAAFDWLISLDPHWYSTIFGVYFFAMSVQAIFAVMCLVTIFFWKKDILTNTIKRPKLYDLAIQLFGFTIFYAYIAFAQYLLIYYGNLPEETTWFLYRLHGGYQYLGYIFLFGRFVIPFFVLLPKTTKYIPWVVGSIASLILFSHFVELYWIVMPTLNQHAFHFSWMTVTCFLGLGCVFLGLLFYRFSQQKMIPINDPKLQESIHKH